MHVSQDKGGYRPDIDGLRALAILFVVLYHARVPYAETGFIGVDVFFAISGYLIVGLLVREQMARGRIDWIAFYARRARRLLPVFTAVAVVSLIGTAVSFFPFGDQQRVAKSVIAAATFTSNIFFWHWDEGYFGAKAADQPFLHTWSLSVEEQFYLLIPLFFAGVTAFGHRTLSHRRMAFALVAILGASYAAAIFGTRPFPNASFYLVHTRICEFAVGALACLVPSQWLGPLLARTMVMAGLGGLGLCLAFAPSAAEFPGAFALLPAAAAAAIMLGVGSMRDTRLPGRILGSRPMVWIGRRSYGWYLWHWPALIVWRTYWLYDTTLTGDLLVIGASLLLAHLTFEWIEQPGRHGSFVRRLASGRQLAAGALLIFVSVGASGAMGLHARWLANNDIALLDMKRAKVERPAVMMVCYEAKLRTPTSLPSECIYQAPGSQLDVVVWGDSHAGALMPAALQAGAINRATVIDMTKGGCPPLVGYRPYGSRITDREAEECRQFNEAALDAIRAHSKIRPTVVVVAARWPAYLLEHPISVYDRQLFAGVTDEDQLAQRHAVSQALDGTLAQLSLPNVETLLVADVGEYVLPIPECVYRFGLQQCDLSKDTLIAHRLPSMAVLAAAVTKREHVRLLDPLLYLCTSDDCPPWDPQGALYFDDDHLSPYGAGKVVLPLAADIRELAQRASRREGALSHG